MIKINLLAEGKRPTAVRKTRVAAVPFLQRDDIAQWTLLLGIVLLMLITGGTWYKFNRELEAKKQEVAEKKREVDKLKEVLKKVEAFEAKKAELQHKIAVINELKANQRGPVRVMDAISRALPELLWLDDMKMQPSLITLNGRAFNPNAVANFIENLDEVEEFREPTLKEISQKGQVYSFMLTFNYSYAPPEAIRGESVETPTTAAAGG